MKKYLNRLLLFLIFSHLCFAGTGTLKYDVKKTPTYTGEPIDLSDIYLFKLYKGEQKIFIADSLSRHQAKQIMAQESNIWWIEISFHAKKEIVDSGNIWFRVHSQINAYELYINRKLFIKNGQLQSIGTAETSGTNIVTQFIKPTLLVDGINRTLNTISIKFSNYEYRDAVNFIDLIITPYDLIFDRAVTWVYAPLILCGFFILAFCLNISFYFSLNKEVTFVLLAVLFLLNLYQMVEEVYTHAGEPSIDFMQSYFIGSDLNYFTYFLLAYCLIYNFRFPSVTKKYLGSLLTLTILILFFSFPSVREFYLSLPPLMIALYATYKKKENGTFLSIALVLLAVLTYLDDFDVIDSSTTINQNLILKSIAFHTDMIGVTLFAFAMVYTTSKRILDQQKLLDETKLKSARLENELLQKHISPHFIMNSLMSLQELIDVDTKQASEMIDSLSEEFHLLATMSKEKMIPLSEEIEICKVHLKIMGLQQRSEFKMEIEGVDGKEMIPPAVIHTLVENGLTHGYSGKQNGIFILKKINMNSTTRYTLFNDSNKKTSHKNMGSKTGLNYVRARLEESYPNRWKLISHAVDGGWQVIIEIENV